MTIRMGIIQVDDTRDELKPQFGCYPSMFSALFNEIDRNIEYKIYNLLNDDFPDTFSECDVYLITGSRHGVYDPIPWIPPLKQWIRKVVQQRIPLIGICFGHQIIAEALGGKVERSLKGWGVGRHEYKVLNQKPWQKPTLSSISLLASHQDQVVKLPSQAEVIASSDFCEHAMVSYYDSVLTLQAHPEFTPAYSQALMEFRCEHIGNNCIAEGMKTLHYQTHHLEMVDWMVNFIDNCLAKQTNTLKTVPCL